VSSLVGLVRKKDSAEGIKDSIVEALNLVGFKFNGSVKSVVIKPNLCYYWDAATGYTTDPQVVGGIIDVVRERCGDGVDIKVAEADASAMRTKYAFPVLGYEKLAEEKSVELFNLSSDVLVDRVVRVGERDISFKVPEVLLKSDLFVNVPKLKIMRVTRITCAMKNVFGCIGFPRKFAYHPFLDEAIVGINKILHPNITIVDGLVALGRFPIRLGLVMAGVDPFSVDCIASRIVGYKPTDVKFLKIAAKENLGRFGEVMVKGENISDFAKVFPRAGFASSNYWWGLQFWLLKAYRKLSGDIIPPVIQEA
jgi:uncharacterized protein (DUF362 family)